MQPALIKRCLIILVWRRARWRTLFSYLAAEVALKTALWPGLPFQITMTYLHNRMRYANIQHDFAINESEERLEMIFDLIEWHNWLDYTKFFFSLSPWGILKCLGGNKQIRLIERDLVHVSVCTFRVYSCMLGCAAAAGLSLSVSVQAIKCFYVGAWLGKCVYSCIREGLSVFGNKIISIGI